MTVCCNPVNVSYKYSFTKDPRINYRLSVYREAADPSLVLFKGRYYIFASMNGCVWVSDDLAHWENRPLPQNMPIYDYAPDVTVVGDWLYFTASNRGTPCSFFRTRDPLNGPYEEIKGDRDYWDPNLFRDDDGRLYFYWGCSNSTPVWGVELDPVTMKPVGERRELIFGNPYEHGYERFGEDHSERPKTEEEIDALFEDYLRECGENVTQIPSESLPVIRATFAGMPYIEGPWMTKHEGKYYLQYACPGTELNIYADGVYVGDSPLGPFRSAENNPYSYKPGGFITGAGHGSTLEDKSGSWWHCASMQIGVCHIFERRVGLWPAGFDADGELFCNQRYGDWPMELDALRADPWAEPEWMLLSYGKRALASSCAEGHGAENAVDERVQTRWKAASAKPGEWLCVDLGEEMDVHAVQINFADDPELLPACPGEFVQTPDTLRFIDVMNGGATQWRLEVSSDSVQWQSVKDNWEAEIDLCHDFIGFDQGLPTRYIRLTVRALPYGAPPCVSGLRVFGRGNGKKPSRPAVRAERLGDLDFLVSAEDCAYTLGYNILWGHRPDKLYHSYLVMGNGLDRKRIGGIMKGQKLFVRVDAFNESGITHGEVMEL